MKRTVAEIEAWLRERDLQLRIWSTPDASIVVWIWCDDDPELGVWTGCDSTLDEALDEACAKWDQVKKGDAS
jgi:hypothetical protein